MIEVGKLWVFVVDTEDYAGNFERNLVAYMTGRHGECEVGKDEAEVGRKDLSQLFSPDGPETLMDWMEEHVRSETDEHGTARPALLWPTLGWFNDGLGNHHRDGTDPSVVTAKYLEQVEEQAQRSERAYADKAHGKKQADRFRAEHTTPGSHHAYLSAALSFDVRPPAEVCTVLEARAKGYCLSNDISYTGCRLLEVETTATEVVP